MIAVDRLDDKYVIKLVAVLERSDDSASSVATRVNDRQPRLREHENGGYDTQMLIEKNVPMITLAAEEEFEIRSGPWLAP